MEKTKIEKCRKCKYASGGNEKEFICYYLVRTGQRRGCPVGYCDKFVKKGRKARGQQSNKK